jgi:heme a synthase
VLFQEAYPGLTDKIVRSGTKAVSVPLSHLRPQYSIIMGMSNQTLDDQPLDIQTNPWPHRWALVLAIGVFPLIWLGGLVTTYEAGMSVPDWPTTFGSWFYPLQKWLWHITDLSLEHSHRTLAQIDGFIFLILFFSIYRWDRRKNVLLLACVIFIALVSQAVLGGFRVRWDDRVLARIHGCAAPLVFALCTAMVSITSAAWRNSDSEYTHPSVRRVHRIAMALSCGLYAEIVLGAQFRHPLPDVSPLLSPILIWSKIIIAALLVAGISYLLKQVLYATKYSPLLARRIKILASLYCLQLLLAAGTWIGNFGWPKWFTDNITTMNYTVVQTGRLQIWLTTAHAAVGSLCFVAALSVTMWSYRLLRSDGNHKPKPQHQHQYP